MTSSRQGPPREPLPMASGLVTNTLDDLMAELGMLRGERGEVCALRRFTGGAEATRKGQGLRALCTECGTR